MAAWTLFLVLVFGPCESLLPLLLALPSPETGPPASGHRLFGTVTVATMLALVAAALLGFRAIGRDRTPSPALAGLADIAAGLAVATTGPAVALFGL